MLPSILKLPELVHDKKGFKGREIIYIWWVSGICLSRVENVNLAVHTSQDTIYIFYLELASKKRRTIG